MTIARLTRRRRAGRRGRRGRRARPPPGRRATRATAAAQALLDPTRRRATITVSGRRVHVRVRPRLALPIPGLADRLAGEARRGRRPMTALDRARGWFIAPPPPAPTDTGWSAPPPRAPGPCRPDRRRLLRPHAEDRPIAPSSPPRAGEQPTASFASPHAGERATSSSSPQPARRTGDSVLLTVGRRRAARGVVLTAARQRTGDSVLLTAARRRTAHGLVIRRLAGAPGRRLCRRRATAVLRPRRMPRLGAPLRLIEFRPSGRVGGVRSGGCFPGVLVGRRWCDGVRAAVLIASRRPWRAMGRVPIHARPGAAIVVVAASVRRGPSRISTPAGSRRSPANGGASPVGKPRR